MDSTGRCLYTWFDPITGLRTCLAPTGHDGGHEPLPTYEILARDVIWMACLTLGITPQEARTMEMPPRE